MADRFPMPLYLPVESHVRELDAKVLLAAVAADRGRDVWLGEQNALRAVLPGLRPGIYVAKSFSPRHRLLQANYHSIIPQMGHVLVGWDEEGLVHLPPEIYAVRRIGPEPLRGLDAVFSWGPDYTALFTSLPYYDGTPVLETGNPRSDLYRSELRDYYAAEAAGLRERFGDFVLINSNFGRINPAVNRTRDKSASGKVSKESVDLKWHALVDHRRQLYAAFRDMLDKLAQALPDRQIVLRPHPAERFETWADIATRHPNLHILHEGTVAPWILASSALIHNGCTTAIESALLGRSAIAYAPITSDDHDWKLPNSVSHEARSYEALLEMLRGHFSGAAPLAVTAGHRAILAKFVAHVEGKLASDLIVDALDRHEREWSQPGNAATRALGRLRARLRIAEKQWQRLVASEKNSNSQGFRDRQFPAFPKSDIAERLERFQSVTGRFSGVRVTKMRERLYRFKKI